MKRLRGLGRFGGLRPRADGLLGGMAAVCVKELRGRMRGRRAFIAITFYVGLLAAFATMLYSIANQSFNSGGGSAFVSAQLGQTIFIGLLLLETLLVLVLTPAFTAGVISGEREKQTFDMLVTTPISPLAIVLGKLVSALAWTFLLIVASIPLTSLVFVFGGAGPDDLIRGYLVLFSTAVGVGAIGTFFSSLARRTQVATVLTYVSLLALTLGTGFLFIFWGVTARWNASSAPPADESLIATLQRRPPEALLWFDPFVADMDVMCGTETSVGGTCSMIGTITDHPVNQFSNGPVAVPMPAGKGVGSVTFVNGQQMVVSGPVQMSSDAWATAPGGQVQALTNPRDTYWPRAMLAWLILTAILVLLSARLISPTRAPRRTRPVPVEAEQAAVDEPLT